MIFDYTWLMSAMTLATMWLAGNKDWRAWVVGLLNQGFWLYFIFDKRAFGLLPMTIVLFCLYVRNLYKWKHKK